MICLVVAFATGVFVGVVALMSLLWKPSRRVPARRLEMRQPDPYLAQLIHEAEAPTMDTSLALERQARLWRYWTRREHV